MFLLAAGGCCSTISANRPGSAPTGELDAVPNRLLTSQAVRFSGALVPSGEPGIGKTALLDHAAAATADDMRTSRLTAWSRRPNGATRRPRFLPPFSDRLDGLPRGRTGRAEYLGVDPEAVAPTVKDLVEFTPQVVFQRPGCRSSWRRITGPAGRRDRGKGVTAAVSRPTSHDTAVRYAAQRRQFGQPLASFQIIQQRLVSLLANPDLRSCGTWST